MTASKLSAGDGYAYYVRETASADVRREKGRELGDYYLDGGNPAGVWVGSGTARLGVSGEVTEAQMKNLFGAGLHPDAEPTMTAMLAAGATSDEAMKWAQLGRAYARFQSPSTELSRALTDAVERAEAVKGAALDPGERRAVRMKTAAISYRERMGKNADSPQELTRWMGAELSKGQQPVAGFDCTFSAPKSVSVLWAAGDETTRTAVEQAHEAAMGEALAYLEEHAAFARVGAGGARQVRTEGLVGTRFRHFTSREGDPQLHDHMVISNKVRRADLDASAGDTDGWVTLDGRMFYQQIHAASSVYDRALADHMRAAGYAMENRPEAGSRKLHLEVAGISEETIREFSGRRQQITARTRELVDQWEAEHLTSADPVTRQRLAQQATLETRRAKDHAEPLAQVQANARARLAQDLPVASPWAALSQPQIDPDAAAQGIVAELSQRRAQWNDAHAETALNLWAALSGATRETVAQVREAMDRHSVTLTPESRAPELLRPAQQVRWYTSTAVLDAEVTVLDAADQLVLPSVTPQQFDAAVAAHTGPLDEGQRALARVFATGEHLVEAGIGPAGAGKTTAMKLAVEAVELSGHRVIGLSTSARAAEVLGSETGAFATSLAMWTSQRQRETPEADFHLNAGDVLVVDEASMASTEHLALVVADAQQAGAFVRLLGDPAQLGAVASGGLLRELDRRHGAVRLESLWRFSDVDEAAAGTRLAATGDVDWYLQHDRVHGVRADQLTDKVMGEWFTQRTQGVDVAVMASTNAEVDSLNAAGQRLMVEAGLVDHSRTVELRNGAVAGVGDTILTRAVDRTLRTHDGRDFVRNGDRWQVAAITDLGAVEAVSETGRRIILPADYLASSTQLGYASTVHVAQGRTVGRGILVATETTDRNALYVGLTRGRDHNQVVVPLAGRTAAQVVTDAASRTSSSVSAHELMAREQAAIDNPAEAIRTFRVVVADADRPRYTAHIRAAYAELYGLGHQVEAANTADQLIQADSRGALDNALRRGEAAGFSVGRLLAATAPQGVDGASDPARVVAWRIDQHLAKAQQQAHSPNPAGPLASYSDAQLAALAERAAAEKTTAQTIVRDARSLARVEAAPVAMKTGGSAPAWTDRPYGHLDRDELAAAMDDAMAAVVDTTREVREAHDQVREARSNWRQHNQPGQRTNPDTVAAAEQLAAAEAHLEVARESDRLARSDYSGLRDEQQTRRHMTGKSWAQETRSRDIARARQEQPATRYTDPAEAQRHRYATLDDLVAATGQLDQARIIDAQVRAEQATRLRVPDMHEPYRFELPIWSGVSNALHDPQVPQAQREQLVEAAQWIGAQLTERGEALAVDPARAPWTRELGPVPVDPTMKARWTQLAGKVDTYRQLAGYTDPDRSLPTTKRGSRAATDIHTLRAAMSDLRQETRTMSEAEQNPRESLSPWLQLRGRTATLTPPETRTQQETTMDTDTIRDLTTEAITKTQDEQAHAIEDTTDTDERAVEQEQAETIAAADEDEEQSIDAADDADNEAVDAQEAAREVTEPTAEQPTPQATAPAKGSIRERLVAIHAKNQRPTGPGGSVPETSRTHEAPSRGRRGPRR